MAEIKYIKDLQRNYLVAVLSEQYQEDYQTTMISKNQIGALLPCNVRRMNGRWLVCYEISRFQSLKEFCLSQQIPNIFSSAVRRRTVIFAISPVRIRRRRQGFAY